MLQLDLQSKIIFYPKPINFHKSFDSLMYLVSTELSVELVPNLFVLFANPRKNRIKILYNDGQHLLLLALRFEYALYFSFQEGVVFDAVSFNKFINTVNPRRRVNRIKNQ
jgi:IS66 Orf2 like protein